MVLNTKFLFLVVAISAIALNACSGKQQAEVKTTTGYMQESMDVQSVHTGEARSAKYIYENRCKTCHGRNTQGAPLPGDRDEWNRRKREKGLDLMFSHAIKGIGDYMPPKGGCEDCTEDEVIAAAKFMINKETIELMVEKIPESNIGKMKRVY